MSNGQVVSLAQRLKARREELGLSQAQAARELDVARTAYRLWELEAAKPQPDRWRLISRWLGVSITTMLLAEELDEELPEGADLVSEAFERVGREWDDPTDPADFFLRAHNLIREGSEKGFLSTEHAQELLSTVSRIEQEQGGSDSVEWEPTKLAKELRANAQAPKAARDAVGFAGSDISADAVQSAQLLVSDLVTNIAHGNSVNNRTIGLLVDIDRARLRVEVTTAGEPLALSGPQDPGEYGPTLLERLSSRWETTRVAAGTLTWFEIDLPQPGAKPERR